MLDVLCEKYHEINALNHGKKLYLQGVTNIGSFALFCHPKTDEVWYSYWTFTIKLLHRDEMLNINRLCSFLQKWQGRKFALYRGIFKNNSFLTF